MTDVINGHSVTDRGDARMRVRVAENALDRPDARGSQRRSAHARAIPDDGDVRQGKLSSRVRNFASSHGGEAVEAFTGSWTVNDRPSSLAEVARRMWPTKGERRRSLPVWLGVLLLGVFRLAVYTLAYLLALAVDTDKRAAVTLAFTLLTVAVVCTAQALPV